MAALTTASLVALYEPDLPLDDDPAPPSTFRSHLISSFGLSKTVTLFNIFALLSSGFTSVCFLVFLNSSQVFVLSDLLAVPTDKIGTITGDLILADELLSLGAVFVWGACCDVMGIRWVAVVGNWLVGMSFVAYVEVKSVFPGLLLARLLFAVRPSPLCISDDSEEADNMNLGRSVGPCHLPLSDSSSPHCHPASSGRRIGTVTQRQRR